MSRLRACLAEPPALSPSTMKISVPSRASRAQSESLPGRRSLRVAEFAPDLLLRLSARDTLLRACGHVIEEGRRHARVLAEPELEPIAHRILDQPGRLRRGQPLLGLALELRLAQEEREQDAGTAQEVVGGHGGGALVADALGVRLEALQEGRAQAGLMGPALRRRHGVAVPAGIGFLVQGPGHRPLDPGVVLEHRLAGEGLVGDQGPPAGDALQKIDEAAGEVKGLPGRDLRPVDQPRRTAPAQLDAAEEIGLAARHAVQNGGVEPGARAENLGIGLEGDRGTAAVLGGTRLAQRPGRRALAVGLRVQHPVARDLDLEGAAERVHHRHADAVQPARGGIGLGAELAARVQGGEDHLERTLVGEFGVPVDRDAAAVVAHRHPHRRLELDLDPLRVAGDRLVHGVVQDLGDEVVQGTAVGAADIHARATADRLQALEHLDVAGVVAAALGQDGVVGEEIGHADLCAWRGPGCRRGA